MARRGQCDSAVVYMACLSKPPSSKRNKTARQRAESSCTQCIILDVADKFSNSFLCCSQSGPWKPGAETEGTMVKTRAETFSSHSELCPHLHEQLLLPQFLIEKKNLWICPDHPGVKVHHAQALQTPSPGESHVRLAALKHTRQRDFHTIQRHSLQQNRKTKTVSTVLPSWIDEGWLISVLTQVHGHLRYWSDESSWWCLKAQ